ncbi:Inositol-1-monophosphatase [Streptomyces sp. S4.7]|nr:Inositol-1-monophosphatase [Streptomyces sp. S4.7]
MYGRPLSRVDKGGGDFATAADLEAEKTILGVIRTARPDDAVLGEEGGRQGPADAERQWLVDPLCGTLNYAAGTMLVAVNVALRGGAAAVADPFSGEIFFTDGRSARVRRDGADAPLTPTSANGLVFVDLDPPDPEAPGFRAVDLLAHPDSPNGSGPVSPPRRSRSPGWPPADARRTSPSAATCPRVCISPPASPCAGPPAAWSPEPTAPRSDRAGTDWSRRPTRRPADC